MNRYFFKLSRQSGRARKDFAEIVRTIGAAQFHEIILKHLRTSNVHEGEETSRQAVSNGPRMKNHGVEMKAKKPSKKLETKAAPSRRVEAER